MSKILSGVAPEVLARFAADMVAWQTRHGRHGLPWQNTRDPYRVWLSEIMLQQTQVSTVLDYFPRFLKQFPDVAALAGASQDEVLGLWSGLGYYSRARNLHRCAMEVMDRFGGAFPQDPVDLQSLPGIGRSTAAAIAAFCFGKRAAILDGNVKRVLTRVLGYGADLSMVAHERVLWNLADDLLPTQALSTAMPRYTQALMDLGATVCLPRKADCAMCPVQALCVERKGSRCAIRSKPASSNAAAKRCGCCGRKTNKVMCGWRNARRKACGPVCIACPCLTVPRPWSERCLLAKSCVMTLPLCMC